MIGTHSTPATDAPRPGGRARVFYHSVRDFLLDLPSSERRFWLLVVATGTASGLGAVFLVRTLAFVQWLSWGEGHSLLEAVWPTSRLHRTLVLTLGGLLVTAMALLLKRPLGGHGTAGVIEAIWLRAGRYSLKRALTNGTLAIVVVAMGAPLGREGALIAFGAGFGSWLGKIAKAAPDQARILVACGGAAGIAAAYNAPIGAALFGLEVFLGSFALELLGPIVICCVTATALSRVLVESHPAYQIPYYRLTAPFELVRITLLAPLLGGAAALYTRVIEGAATIGERVPRRFAPYLPILAMAATGVAAWWFPEILGNGYDTANQALLGRIPLRLLLLLPMLKLLATSTCSGAGVPGGLFTPSLYFGALLGGALGVGVHHLWPGVAPSGAYALIGMAGILAGTTHAAVSAVLILFEMTRDYGVILPLMLTSVIAAAVARGIDPESIYTGVLRRRNVKLPERPRPQWLQETAVQSLLRKDFATAPPGLPFEEVLLKLISLPPGQDLYVTSPEGHYLGVIVLDDLKGNLPDRAQLGFAVAADLMDDRLPPLAPAASLAEAAARFATTHLDKLPVVDGNSRLVGIISKQDLFLRGQF